MQTLSRVRAPAHAPSHAALSALARPVCSIVHAGVHARHTGRCVPTIESVVCRRALHVVAARHDSVVEAQRRAGSSAAARAWMSTKPGKGAMAERKRSPVVQADLGEEAADPAVLADEAGGASQRAGDDAAAARADAAAAAALAAQTHIDPSLAHPYHSKVTYDPSYAIDIRNPVEHTFAHSARYFPLWGKPEEASALFPEGVPSSIAREFSVCHSHSIMVRPSGVAMVQHLERWRRVRGRELAAAGASVLDATGSADASGPHPSGEAARMRLPRMRSAVVLDGIAPAGQAASEEAELDATDFSEIAFRPFRVLTGPSGGGKTAMLTYLVAYARRNDWIVLFMPDTFDVMNKGLVLVPSRLRPGMVDQHDVAVRVLKNLLTAHRHQLERVPQRGKYAVFRYLPKERDVVVSAQREELRRQEDDEKSRLKAQAEAKGTVWDASTYVSKYESEEDTNIDRSKFTLRDMAEWGIAHPASATDALLDLLRELRQTTEFPVMIAIDGMNLLYEKTPYPQAGRLLDAEELSIPSALHCLDDRGFKSSHAMKRGIILGTITQAHGHRMRMFEVANVRERFRVRVPELTRDEVHSQLLHYHHTQKFLMLMDRSSVDPFAVEYYRTLSSGLPGEIFRVAMFHDAAPRQYETNKAKRNRMRHASMN